MSTDRAPGIQSTGLTDDELADQLNQLQRRVDDLEAENDQLHSELEQTHEQQREDRHALAREHHDLRTELRAHRDDDLLDVDADDDGAAGLTDISIADVPIGTLLDKSIQNSLDAKDAAERTRSDATNPRSDADETTLQRPDPTPMDQIQREGDDVGFQVTTSDLRAATICEHWTEWTQKTPKGRVLKDGLKTLLQTAREETLAWKQVYRACEALQKLTKGKIHFTDHRRHGKMLIQSSEGNGSTPNRGHCQSSSVATT